MENEKRDWGALFKNESKETEKHPDYKGNITIDWVEHWISGWMKESKDGMVYMSLSAQVKGDKPAKKDDIPF